MNFAVGLDIGWKDIKALELAPHQKVTKIGKIEIQRPLIGDENAEYITKINELFSKLKLFKENVVINLRGSPILARTYAPPSENREDFEKWFVDSIESLIPGTPIADVVYDHQFLKSGRVLISFARLTALENKIKLLKSCSIIPAVIDAASLALYHAFDVHPWIGKKKNLAIIDIGTYSTDLLIVKEGEPFISTEIVFGGKDLVAGKETHRIFADELLGNLSKNINFYSEKENLKIEGLIIVGDYSDIPDLQQKSQTTLGIEVEIGDPFKLRNIELPPQDNNKNNQQYTQALGLALKGLNPKKEINLMPTEAKEEHRLWHLDKKAKTFFQKNIIPSGIVLVALLFLFSFVLIKNHEISRAVSELKVKVSELAYVNAEERELNAKISKLRQLSSIPFVWSKMFYNVGSAVPEGVFLEAISTESRLVATSAGSEKKSRVVIEGEARNEEDVVKFLKNLEKYYKDVALEQIKKGTVCAFKISLVL